MEIEDCFDCKWKLATNECLKNVRKSPQTPDSFIIYPCYMVCTACTFFERDVRGGVTHAR